MKEILKKCHFAVTRNLSCGEISRVRIGGGHMTIGAETQTTFCDVRPAPAKLIEN